MYKITELIGHLLAFLTMIEVSKMALRVVILAAGQGKRMHSDLPKVLHRLGGKSLLEHVIQTAISLDSDRSPIIIYGHQGELLFNHLGHYNAHWVKQDQQLGTGHALLQALPAIESNDQILILYGDVPLISETTLKNLINNTSAHSLGMLTANLPAPEGYGRIKRNEQGQIIRVIEAKDASSDELRINEINPGIYYVTANYLKRWLPQLRQQNAQGEYYLTDIIAMAVNENMSITAIQPAYTEEILGINDRLQLEQLERFYQRQVAEKLMQKGVSIADKNRFDSRCDELKIGRDVFIDVNVIFEGRVVIGDGCYIGPHVVLRNTELGKNIEIKASSIIDGAVIGANASVGPFARIRPGTVLGESVHIGNFVEVKNSFADRDTKINHLSYVGDSEIGARVNIGAGTITCNYDGINKHKTIIEDDVHIGSDTQLIAPVSVGKGATIGAGSTIRENVPPYHLALTQTLSPRHIKAWKRPEKLK